MSDIRFFSCAEECEEILDFRDWAVANEKGWLVESFTVRI